MSAIPIYARSGEPNGEIEFSDALLTTTRSKQLIQDVVTAYRANQRSCPASTKTRGEVVGSNRKPWKQKGTGNARAGRRSSPIWRGGGVCFGPRPRDFRKKLTRKASRMAFRIAVSDRIRSGMVRVVDEFSISEPRTKEVVGLLQPLALKGNVLLIVDQVDRSLYLASRNLADVEVIAAKDANTYQLIRHRNIVFSRSGLAALEERLQKYVRSVA